MLFHMLEASEKSAFPHECIALCNVIYGLSLCMSIEWEGRASVKNQQENVIVLWDAESWCTFTKRPWLVMQYNMSHPGSTDGETQQHWKHWAYWKFPPSQWWEWALGGSDVGPRMSRCSRLAGGWGSAGCCSGWRFRLSEGFHSRSQWKGNLKEGGCRPTSWSEVQVGHRAQSTTPPGSESRL